MKIRGLLILLAMCVTLHAEQLAIGHWRTHLAYTATQQMAQTPEKVYGVSGGALFTVDKDDNSVELLSKITGLNDNNVVQIGYSETQKMLVVAYATSNIDLIADDGSIYNITDLYRKNMAGDKTINHIYCRGENAYLSCAFGIVVLDLKRREVLDTYIIGSGGTQVGVTSLCEYNGSFYATTANAVMTAPLTGVNLANFENWSTIAAPSSSTNVATVVYNNTLYLLQSNKNVYKYANAAWNKVYSNIVNICADGQHLFLCEPTQVQVVSDEGTRAFACANASMVAYDAAHACMWGAANDAGIVRIDIATGFVGTFCPNGPAVNYAWKIRYSNGKMYVVPGGRWAVQYARPGHVMIFDNDTWMNISQSSINAKVNAEFVGVTSLWAQDFIDVAIDPNDDSHFFVAAYGMGLYEFRNFEPYRLYNADNSDIESIYPSRKPEAAYYLYQRVGGLEFDNVGNLWILEALQMATLRYMPMTANGHNEMVLFDYSDFEKIETPQDIVFSKVNDHLRFVLTVRNPVYLYAIYDNGTIDNLYDDVTRRFSSFTDQDGNVIAPDSRCIAQDQNGSLWIGMSDGIITLNNVNNIFNADYNCTRIKIPRNDGTNLADYLLDGVQVNAIAVDGANRKWIGTESNGVFLVSPDGLETIEHFTSDNSPLLSNNIISIGINEKTGEVFFGTGNGLISYQSDATEGNETFSNVHAFPNPVREDYDGVITITGLMTDTRVKITDIAGNVVYETISNGGVATWDGNRRGGGRVATGVYLVMCFSSDGKQHETTKILVINR